MGQNFLIEEWVPRELVNAAQADKTCGALEIGPGIGPLTVRLADQAQRVVAVELDRTLFPVLAETLRGKDNVEIVPGDVMKLDIAALVADKFSGLTPIACANLPYNITTPVLTALLESGCFRTITVMIQKEAAERICAAPGTGDYGAFSVYCQYHADCEFLFPVPPECFLPAPKVTSAVMRMTPRSAPPVEVRDEKAFFQVVKASFAQRRKTLLNGLSAGYGSRFSKDELRAIIERCALPADVRGERLGIPEFERLARALNP